MYCLSYLLYFALHPHPVDGADLVLTEAVCLFFQLDEACKIKNTDIAKELSLPPVKLHCSSEFLIRFPHHISLSKLLCTSIQL